MTWPRCSRSAAEATRTSSPARTTTTASRAVLDASALLALMLDEPGGDEVEAALGAGAGMSAVNWAEALSASADAGIEPESVEDDLTRAGIFGEALTIIPLDAADGSLAARLRPLTRRRGLSLADRACLALAIRMDRPVLIADPAWADLRLGVEVRLIRP